MSGANSSSTVVLICISAFLGGLFGGFFAFVFGQLGRRLDRNRKRWAQHHNALVRLENYYNTIFSLKPDIALQYKTVQHVCNAKGDGPIVAWSQPSRVPYESGIMDDLLSLEMKNLLFGLQLRIRRYNDAVDTTVRATTGLHDALIAGRISRDVYRENLRSFGENIDSIQKFIGLIDDSALEIAAHTTLLLRKDGKRKWWNYWSIPTPAVATLEEVAIMRDEIAREILQVAGESKNTLAKYGIHPPSNP